MPPQTTIIAAVTACLSLAWSGPADALERDRGLVDPATPITVMTRNVYVGADIFRVVEADPSLLLPTIGDVYATVIETNFAERAEVLADEVALHQPHVIGLQEVALLRRQSPGDVFFGNPEPATEVELDYLQIYLDALADRGLDYSVAAVVENADIELPIFAPMSLDDIRLTDRDVTLVRGDVMVQDASIGNYTDNVVINLSGAVIDFNRGYTAATVTIDGRNYRVVNTHLEVGGQPEIQGNQAAELLDLLADEPLPLIVIGDFNASPEDPPVQAYARLVAAGFEDVWLNRSVDDNDPGLTCCFGETLDDSEPDFSERIDILFVRNRPNTALESVDATVIGANAGMQTASGLWPSDHAGVVATFRVLGPGDDGDGDGVIDGVDNCVEALNPDQRDTDNDGFGNVCDSDFNQDGIVNYVDLNFLRMNFMTGNPDADLDGDGVVNASDLMLMRSAFFGPPGPSGVATRF